MGTVLVEEKREPLCRIPGIQMVIMSKLSDADTLFIDYVVAIIVVPCIDTTGRSGC